MKNIDTDMTIDPNILDIEWMLQPQRFMEASVEVVKARRALDEAKSRSDIVSAEMDKAVRRKYTPKDKPTETAIKSEIATLPKVQKAHKDILDASEAVGIWNALVSALDQRKRALENLVTLRLGPF